MHSANLKFQVWGALHKAWKDYVIVKNKGEDEKMELYACRIQELQHDLGLDVVHFLTLGCQQQAFFWQIAQEENDSQEQQVAAEQNYLGDSQYERERFTDKYNEGFEDDVQTVPWRCHRRMIADCLMYKVLFGFDILDSK